MAGLQKRRDKLGIMKGQSEEQPVDDTQLILVALKNSVPPKPKKKKMTEIEPPLFPESPNDPIFVL